MNIVSRLYLRYVGALQAWRIARMTRNPMMHQYAVLARIVAANRDTEFGLRHGFAHVRHYTDFVRHVPVGEFEDLRAYVENEIAHGTAALTTEVPVCYMRTSGTTGKPKDLPLVSSHLSALRRIHRTAVALQYRNYPEGFGGGILALTSPANEGFLPNGKPYGSASGIVSRNTSRLVRGSFVLPHAVLAISDSRLKYLLILRLALARRDISYIGAANPSTLLALMQLYREHREALIESVRSGGFFLEREVPPDIMATVRPRLSADPTRASELTSIASSARIADLWPGLRLIVAWTCASAGVAARALEKELIPATKILELGYVSSEFRGTITIGRSSGSGLPTLDTHFFEFVEQGRWEAGEPEFLPLDGVRKGGRYYVVVTTPSGLYRYFINDLVQVTGFLHRTPLLRFVQKGKGVTSITGEKLYESQVLDAVGAILRSLGQHAHFLMMVADEQNALYRLYVETDSGDASPDSKTLASLVDARLMDINLEYQAKRESRRLGEIEAHWLQHGTGEAYKRHSVALGQREGQFKLVALAYQKDFDFDFGPYLAKGTT